MNAMDIQKQQAYYADLMARANVMRACGYHASADALMQRAWACGDGSERVTLQHALDSMHLTRGAREGVAHHA
ncbi:MAG: hypothetical protein EPO09_19540 [Aquabacterium sp.]|uniref:hypothetical protein n=1 Tax=Aquabacterium sp. TaxID=1872578 RepID=UPI001221A2E1|nr:hypothetical protein [Aquabacterium sp.]TAK86603.1 MAG: hypothetical protein EPO09_19540 [Aquabacterium sp.]